MRSIVSWCLDHRSVVVLGALMVLAVGVVAGGRLKRELIPPIDFPVLTVSTPTPGSDPESVALEVTEPLERAISGLTGVKRYRSFSVDGFSNIVVEYDLSVDPKEAQTDLERALGEVALPDEAQSPRISRISMVQGAEIIFSVVAEKDPLSELTEKVKDEIVPLLRKAEGAGAVRVRGGTDRRIEVRLDPKKLAEKGISSDQVVGALRAINLTLPAGAVTEEKLSVPVRVAGELKSVRDLKDVVVGFSLPGAGLPTAGGAPGGLPSGAGSAGSRAASAGSAAGGPPAAVEPVRLEDVAQVRVAADKSGGISRTDGKPSLSIEIEKEPGANSVVLSQAVREVVPEMREAVGGNRLDLISDGADFIQESINNLIEEGLIGALLVIIIVFLFLRSGRATLVTAVSIPTSLLVALIFAWAADVSLNILTLSGLTIAIGRVIDDSIVVLENIYTRTQMGDDARTAALEGTTEVASAIASSTLSAVAVFLPIGLVGGMVSEFFLSFSLIVALALLASFAVSVTLVPVLANMLLGGDRVRHSEGAPLLKRAYTPLLGWSLRHRAATVVIGFLIFAGSLALFPSIPQNFMPDTGFNELVGRLELPAGTSLGETAARLRPLEKSIGEEEGVTIFSVDAGGKDPFGDGGSTQAGNEATIWVRLEEDAEVEPILSRLQERGEDLFGKDLRLQQVQGGPQSGRVELVLSNASLAKLRRANTLVLERLKGIEDIEDLRSDLTESKPEFSVKLDREKATRAGLTTVQVAGNLRTLLHGQEVGEIPVDGHSLPVHVASLRSSADEPKDLEALPVGAGGGGTLGDIASIEEVDGPVTIGRSDGERAATVTARITVQDTGKVSSEIDSAVKEMALPSGTKVRVGGEMEDVSSAFRDMGIAMAVAVVLVYLVLVVFFGSLLHPFTIILSLPLASIGALGALLVSGQALGLPALLGMLMLIGIVVSNAILLVDFIQRARRRGESRNEAEMLAGRRRLRPILMTAIVTIGALTPLALGLVGGILISASLATVVIGGLATSTLLTLVVIPSVYSLLDSARVRIFGDRGS